MIVLPLVMKTIGALGTAYDDAYHQERFKVAASPHTGDWLLALLLSSCGLWLDDEVMRIALALCLGVSIYQLHGYPCDSLVAVDGPQGLSCGLGPGRLARHTVLNDLIGRSLTRAGIPNTKELPGLSRSDGKQPDDLTP